MSTHQSDVPDWNTTKPFQHETVTESVTVPEQIPERLLKR